MKFDVVKVCAGLIIILALLMGSGMATETTWRFSGFELYGYDINFTDHNATNVRNLDAENITSKLIGGVIYVDQYASIQDAINASDVDSDGYADYEVYIPLGIYNSNSINLISNLTLRGAGAGSYIKLNDAVNDPLLLSNGADNLIITNLYLDGNKDGQSSSATRDFRNSENLVFSNNIVANWETSMIFSNISGLWIENNQNIDSNGDGFFVMDFSENIHINFNEIVNSYDDGIAVGQAGVTTNPRTQYIEIIGNIINCSDPCIGSGIRVHSHVQDAIISSNIIVALNSTSGDGIEYLRYSSDPGQPSKAIITSNIVKNFGRHGIKAGNITDGVVIANNLIDNSPRYTGYGLYLSQVNDSSITDNIVINTNFGFFIYGFSTAGYGGFNNSIQGNLIKNTTQYGIHLTPYSSFNTITNNKFESNNASYNSYVTATGNTIRDNMGMSPFDYGNRASAPTPFGAGDEYYNSTDNIKYSYDGSNWKSLTNEYFYGEAHVYNNAVATVIETADTPIALRQITTGSLNGWTFDAGSTGAITAYADGSGGKVTVSDASHGLSNGDIITIRGTTNYNGVFTVSDVTTDAFTITDTWVADDGASDWDQGASLIAGANSAGIYTAAWQMSSAPVAAMTITWMMYINAVPQTKTTAERKYPINDKSCCASTGVLTISAGDVVWLSIQSDDTASVTNKHGNFNLHKIC